MANTIAVSILADARELQKNLDKAEGSVKDFGNTVDREADSARRGLEGVAEGADATASASAQAAGGLGDIAGALEATGLVSEGTAAAMETGAAAIMGITGAADLANFATEKLKLATIANKVQTVAATAAQKTAAAATKAWAAAQRLLNIAFLSNPIGLIILAIVALVAVFVIAYKKSETFRNIVNGVWRGVKVVALAVVEWFKTAVPAAWETVKTKTSAAFNAVKNFITGAFNAAKNFFMKYTLPGLIISKWDTIKSKTKAAFDAVKGFITRPITAARDTVSGLVDRMVGKFTGIKGRVAGKFSGMFDGIGSSFRGAVNSVIRGWNGLSFTIPSVSVLGKQVFGGSTISTPNIPYLASGGIVSSATLAMIGEGKSDEAVIPLNKNVLAKYGLGATTIYLTVNAGMGADGYEVGRASYNALSDYMKKSGKRL